MSFLLHQQASGQCSHGGVARPLVGNPRVKLAGQPVLTTASLFAVTGCPNHVGPLPFPCLIGVFARGANRVTVMGLPVLLDSSRPTNLPTGASTTITATQARVKGL